MMIVCFEYRASGRGKRRGFAHASCVPFREDGTRQWDTQVVVPSEDLTRETCVLCERPMLSTPRKTNVVTSAPEESK